ncbi:DEAD/DEAH box helicase family protein [Nostoc sp.]
MKTVEVTYAGLIKVTRGEAPKELYSHQNEAIKALNKTNEGAFEGLLVLPTGGGKTFWFTVERFQQFLPFLLSNDVLLVSWMEWNG